MTPRLKPGLWVRATVRTCETRLIPAFVMHKGDEDVGSVLVKVNRFGAGCRVFTRITNLDGESEWMAGTGDDSVSEPEADDYIRRQLGFDADLWVVEIEDHKQEFVLEE